MIAPAQAMNAPIPLILNVDDSDGARYAKSRILQLAGFEVIEAGTGQDALAQVHERRPDLVLLDMKLPDMNGFDVCRHIKDDPATASVLVLQTSASLIDSLDRVRGLDSGADNYLVAPVEPHELIANVKALLRLRDVQRELHENEQRFRQLAENIADTFWVFDPVTVQLLYVSPAYEKLWGLPSAPLYTQPRAWLDAVDPRDRERVGIAFEQFLKFEKYEQEFRVLRPDGGECWIRDRGFPIENEQGVNYRVVRISEDITVQKQAEQALTLASVRKDEFLATLAHELRNPLAPMRTAVELMRMVSTNSSGKGAREPAQLDARKIHSDAREIIARQIDHLVRLVDDLLDVSRITQGKLSLQKSRVELRAVVKAALETSEAFLRARGHRLEVELPQEILWIDGDSVRLAQVIGNLLHNAAKYTPEGGTVSLRANALEGNLTISIEDNGIGIPADQLDRIFDLFTQAQRLENRAPEGLGVGLSLVKRLIELHGGHIEVHSDGLGRGSRFTITLPIAARSGNAVDRVAGARRSKLAGANGTKPLRILLVDDSVDAVNMLSQLLCNLGHETAIAHDGPSALDTATQFLPHLILLDIGLPGMDGYEVARALRQLPDFEATPLVALTGYGQARDREQALAAGFSSHLIKPLNFDDLNTLLESNAIH